MTHTTDQKLTRRGFLQWFSSEGAVAVGHTLAASVPLLGGILANQKHPRASRPAPDDDESLAHCTRCYAPFKDEQDQTLCPDCHAAEVKNQSLLRDLFKDHA